MKQFALLIVSLAIAVGCKSDPSIVGKWTSQADIMGIKATTTTENRADGTFTSITKSETGPNGASLTATDSGTWKLDGDRLSITLKDVDWKFAGASSAAMKRANERFQSNKANIIAEANRSLIGKIKWNGNDEFIFTGGDGKPDTYRRAK